MSHALKNAAESTVHAFSDLVEGARDRLEDLPPLSHGRRRTNHNRLMIIVVCAVVGLAVVIVRRGRQRPVDENSTIGARMAEKSLAVS
jgi:hypothetical protein